MLYALIEIWPVINTIDICIGTIDCGSPTCNECMVYFGITKLNLRLELAENYVGVRMKCELILSWYRTSNQLELN